MSVTLKRVYDAASPNDGTRVLVDRLWPRGLTKERAKLDLWLKDIAPSPALRTWFAHDPERWDEFKVQYVAELNQAPHPVAQLRALIKAGPVTLLYAAKSEVYNHARVLLDYIKQP